MANPLLDLDASSVHLLLSVAELGSISKAAARHGLSQPSASRRVKDLERRLGVSLVDRSTGGAALSSAGRHLAEELRDVVAATETLVEAAAGLRSDSQLALSLAATRPTARHDLGPICADLRTRLPETDGSTLNMHVELMSTLEVCNAVRDSAADLGIVDGPRAPIGLTDTLLRTVQLVLVVNPHHAWARRRRTISREELLGTSLLLPRRKTGTRDVIEEALRRSSNSRLASPAIEAGTDERLALAALGPHPTFVRSDAAKEAMERCELVSIPIGFECEQPIRIVWRGRKPAEPGGRRFVEIALESSASRSAIG